MININLCHLLLSTRKYLYAKDIIIELYQQRFLSLFTIDDLIIRSNSKTTPNRNTFFLTPKPIYLFFRQLILRATTTVFDRFREIAEYLYLLIFANLFRVTLFAVTEEMAITVNYRKVIVLGLFYTIKITILSLHWRPAKCCRRDEDDADTVYEIITRQQIL